MFWCQCWVVWPVRHETWLYLRRDHGSHHQRGYRCRERHAPNRPATPPFELSIICAVYQRRLRPTGGLPGPVQRPRQAIWAQLQPQASAFTLTLLLQHMLAHRCWVPNTSTTTTHVPIACYRGVWRAHTKHSHQWLCFRARYHARISTRPCGRAPPLTSSAAPPRRVCRAHAAARTQQQTRAPWRPAAAPAARPAAGSTQSGGRSLSAL